MAEQDNISRAQRLLDDMNKKYGSTPAVQAEPPKPAPPPPAPPKEEPGSLLKRAAGIIGGRKEQIDKASGYACGGKVKAHASGGKVKTIKGPGTSTSDSIPAKVKETGEPILVSNGERILSKKQDQLLGKIAKMLGYKTTDELLASGTGRPVGPTMKDGKKAAKDGSDWLDIVTKAISPVSPAVAATEAAPVIASDIGSKIFSAQDEKIGPSKTPVGFDKIPAMFADAAKASNTANTKTYEQIRAEREATLAPTKKTVYAPAASRSGAANPNSVYGDTTGATKTAATSPIITGRNDKGVITADSAQAAYGNNMQRSGGVFGTYDGKGVNDILARENAARGGMIESMVNANGPAGAGFAALPDNATLPGGGLVSDWNNTVGMSAGDKAKYMLARQGVDNGRYATDVQAQRAAGHDSVLMRGQDMVAQTEANRLQGSPYDKAKAANEEQIIALRGQYMNAKTPEEQARIRVVLNAINGKDGDVYTPHVVGGGEDEMGRKLPQRLAVTHKQTGQTRFEDGKQGQQSIPQFKTVAEMQAALKAGKIAKGQAFMDDQGIQRMVN